MNNSYFTRKFTAAVLLLMACSAFLPISSRAVTRVIVAGVEVSDEQDCYVEAPEGSDVTIEGVWYYPSTNTLLLDNATIIAHGEGVSGIWAVVAGEGSPELTIKLMGESTIISDYVAIYGQNEVSFVNGHVNKSQRPILHVSTTNAIYASMAAVELILHPYWMGNCQVVVDGCDLDVQSTDAAIKGWYNYGWGEEGDPHFVDITLSNNATLRARTSSTNATDSPFRYVKGLNYNGEIQMPRQCSYDATQMAFVNNNTHQPVYPKEVRIAQTIQFEDQEVKNICLQNWDGNADGELDYIEARLVTSLGENFKENTTITSFNELMWFSGLINLDEYAFYGCSNLQQVEMPYNLKTIGFGSFWACSSLNIVTIPWFTEEIYSEAFYECYNLSNVVFDPDCQLKRIGFLAFGCCPINYMLLPNHLEYIGEQAFWDNRLTQLTIPASVTTIEKDAFNQVNTSPSKFQKIVFQRSSPPTVGQNAFGATEDQNAGGRLHESTQIYVPKWYINNYKSDIPQYAPYMVAREGYGIYICGQELASDNLGSDGSFSYSNGNDRVFGVYYDKNTNTLTMKDGQIVSNSTSRPAIVNYYSGMNIKLEGLNSIYSKQKGIESSGILNISSTVSGVSIEKPMLDIQCVKAGIENDNSQFGTYSTIEFHNVEVGISSTEGPCIDGGPYVETWEPYYLQVGDPASVLIENGTFSAFSPTGEIIRNVPSFDLENCRIMRPTEGIYYNGEPIDGHLWWTPISMTGLLYISSWIEFQDPLVEQICVDNFDENGDGGIDLLEASNVTSLGTVFKGTDIQYFNELKYFVALEEIGDEAFKDCTSLFDFSYPNTTNFFRIGNQAFYNCQSLWAMYIPSTVIEIGDYAYSGTQMEMISIPASVKTIGEGAFQYCMGVYFSDDAQLESIGDYAFFRMSSGNPVEIPASVKTIGEYAFADGCGGVTFAEDAQLESIGEQAFYGLWELPSMLPAKVKHIGTQAFDSGTGENNYLDMTVMGYTPATIGGFIFGLLSADSKIYVPAGTASIYKKAWPEYADYIVSDDGPTAIKNAKAENSKRRGVFTLDGRMVRSNADINGLPAGLYIVNGKKVSVK